MSSVYVYDEVGEQWQSAAPLPQPLSDHRCIVLNCQGLVCGGLTDNVMLCVRFFQDKELPAERVETVLLIRWSLLD